MATYNDIVNVLKKKSRMQLQVVADEAGVSFHTLIKLVNGQTPNPRIRTVEPLLKWHSRSRA